MIDVASHAYKTICGELDGVSDEVHEHCAAGEAILDTLVKIAVTLANTIIICCHP